MHSKRMGERIKSSKNRVNETKDQEEKRSVEQQACIDKQIPSLPLKAYPLLRIKNSFGHKPFKSIPSK